MQQPDEAFAVTVTESRGTIFRGGNDLLAVAHGDSVAEPTESRTSTERQSAYVRRWNPYLPVGSLVMS